MNTGPLSEKEMLEAAAMAGFMSDKRAAGYLLRLIGEVRRYRLGRRLGRHARNDAVNDTVELNKKITNPLRRRHG